MTARIPDLNGWYEIKDNPLSRVGVFPYLGSTIDPRGTLGLDPNKAYQVLRPAEELSDPECLQSLKLLPWIDEHTPLGEMGVPAEQVGVQGTIGEQVYFDPESEMIRGNIKVYSETLKRLIESEKNELSCGYQCVYEPKVGIYKGQPYEFVQRRIRGNHLALVDQGRMGPEVAVLDSMKITIDSKEFVMSKKTKVDPKKVTGDEDLPNKEGEDGEEEGGAGGDMTLADVVKMLGVIGPQVAKLTEAMAALNAPKEPAVDEEVIEDEEEVAEDEDEPVSMDSLKSENKKLKSDLKKLTTTVDSLQKNTEKTLISRISERDRLASNLSDHIGTFDHSKMTLQEVAEYGVKKLEISCDSGQEISLLKGFLHNRKPNMNPISLDSKGESCDEIDAYINRR